MSSKLCIDHFTRCKQHWSRNCFLYFTCKEIGCILSQLLCSVKKLKQEVLLDQCCSHLVKWSIAIF